MAGRADFLVDLEAALGGRAIISAERPGEMPVLVLQFGFRLGGNGDGAAGEGGQGDGAGYQELTHGAYPIFFLSTASAMLGGIGSGRSTLPRTGSRMRKWKK